MKRRCLTGHTGILGIWLCMATMGPMMLAADPPAVDQNPREILALFEMGPDFFSQFKDHEPLTGTEQEKLLALGNRLQKIPPAARQAFSLPVEDLRAALNDPSAARGQIYALSGLVRKVEQVPLEEALAKRFDRTHWYRCQVELTDGLKVEVFAWQVPAAWALDAALEDRCAALALFVKLLPAPASPPDADPAKTEDARPIPLLVTTRLGYQPRNVLGDLGMDFGLFDDVRDRTALNEGEAFYQLLAAVRRAEPGQLEREAAGKLASLRAGLEKIVRDRDLDAKTRAAAERAIKRASQGTSDVVPLFNEPAAQRGKLFLLRGEALRAIEVRVNDPDTIRRFGFDHYYEVEIVTLDSANNPIVCCVAELPPDMPLGQSIHENVSVAGFFLKSWAFGTQQTVEQAKTAGEKRRQLAPLLVARTLQVLPAPVAPPEDVRWTIGATVVGGLLLLAGWYVLRRGTARGKISRRELPERIPLDDFAPDADA